MVFKMLASASILIALAAAPVTAHAEDAAAPKQKTMLKTSVKTKGLPHKLQSIARLNAIRSWNEIVLRHGKKGPFMTQRQRRSGNLQIHRRWPSPTQGERGTVLSVHRSKCGGQ